MRSKKLKRLEDVSQLKKDPFALYSNYSFEIVILVMFLKKLSKLVFFCSAYYAHCTFRRRQGWGGLVKCSLTFIFKVGYFFKREAYFETRRNYNIPLLISKSENVISCHWRCLPLSSVTLKLVGFVPKFD